MENKQLFRKEALDGKRLKWLGEAILIRPLSFAIFTSIAIGFALVILAFLVFGSYTKRATVFGQLIPHSGVIRIYALDTGVIMQKMVHEGQTIKKGDPLYLISTGRYNQHGELQQSILEKIQDREQSLLNEKQKLISIHENTFQQLSQQINSTHKDLKKIDILIREQYKRVELSQSSVDRYQKLFEKEYISADELQTRQDQLLDQQLRLQSFERDRINKQAELVNQKFQLAGLADRNRNEVSGLERQINTIAQESIETQARKNVLIRANASGIATAINAEVGQQIVAQTPILNIVPSDAQLEAHLYLPSQNIGFVQVGQSVRLRYKAFPYQKFGQATGIITSIADSAMNRREILNLGELSAEAMQNNEAVYLVKVKLNQQTIQTYGKSTPLKVGMAFDADIMQDTRKLYEWVLEPFYSISGKM